MNHFTQMMETTLNKMLPWIFLFHPPSRKLIIGDDGKFFIKHCRQKHPTLYNIWIRKCLQKKAAKFLCNCQLQRKRNPPTVLNYILLNKKKMEDCIDNFYTHTKFKSYEKKFCILCANCFNFIGSYATTNSKLKCSCNAISRGGGALTWPATPFYYQEKI